MDQGRHRGGASHGVTQPGLQGELCRLTTGCHQQEQADNGQPAGGYGTRSGGGQNGVEVNRTHHAHHGHHGGQQTHVTDTVHYEGLLGGDGVLGASGLDGVGSVGVGSVPETN